MLWVLRACASFRFQFCALKLAPSKREFLASNSLLSTRGLKSNAIVVEYDAIVVLCAENWEPTGNAEEFCGPNYQNAWRAGDMWGFLFTQIPFHVNSIFTKIVPVEKKETTRSFMKCESVDWHDSLLPFASISAQRKCGWWSSWKR